MKKIVAAVLCAALLLALAACGGENPSTLPDPDAETTPTPAATSAPTPSPTPEPVTDPLSGEPIDEDISAKRPWAVMHNNLKQALPQRGVSQAEILYEIPAEGGVTRMMGIYTDISDVEALGSMRSLRPYYAEVAFSYDGIIVHAGGSEAAYSLVAETGWDHLDGVRETYDSKPFERDPNRMGAGTEHSLFANGPKLILAAEERGFDLEHEGGSYDYGLSFTDDAAAQCSGDAETARINFNTFKYTSFEYNADEGVYYATQYDAPYIDETSGEQLSFANLLFLQTDISIIDSYGRLQVRLNGEGNGWFVSGGRWTEITWERSEEGGAFHYYLPDGSELAFGVGHTYVGVIGSDYGYSVELGSEE